MGSDFFHRLPGTAELLHCVAVVESAGVALATSPLDASVCPRRAEGTRTVALDDDCCCSLTRFCCSMASNLSRGVDKLLLSSGGGGMAIQLY